ncbi:CRE-DAF-1 protein [Caenorhabditis remanei]|uniref:receptor protein serine/threonine kinase n=1 Tax=Caenorhabditis remanei TaxID=31234 RepID=E3M6Y4_CAERE|nr:CRE-DAF-1 protein [Caenorhabditis remanei]
MRIGHSVFFLFFFYVGVFSFDEDIETRTNLFIQQRLIPALKEAHITHVNFTRLRLCHCSTEDGCNSRTTGWVPSLTSNVTEKIFYKNTCYTDGHCYQNARPSPELSHFGCMDSKSLTDDNDFHDTAAKVCSNTTYGSLTSYWVCCNSANFCANETVITLPPLPQTVPYWGWTLITLGVLIFIFGLCYQIRKPWEEQCICFLRSKISSLQTPRDLERNKSNANNRSTPSESQTYDQNHTMSTTLDRDKTACLDGLPPGTRSMLLVLEESDSGSGFGSTKLHVATISKQIRLGSKIGAGRFGTVSRGTFKGEAVAVKIFRDADLLSFDNEREIFETRMLRHPQILRFIGSDRVDKGLLHELWIVTEYHPLGSLHDFLLENVITIDIFNSLITSAAKGLAFLHDGYDGTTNSCKPQFVHRDVKSRNIMVKEDLTCAIGDLGLAIVKPPGGTIPQHIAEKYKCGTVRYLAPEILNSTMSSYEFESYQRADVYSFSLVMWETLCRVEEGEVKARSAETVIPYIEWTVRDPTDEQMTDVVCTRNLRPPENPQWDGNKKIQYVTEIIQSCWSANPTARYTAFQLKTRLDYKISEEEEDNKEQLQQQEQLVQVQDDYEDEDEDEEVDAEVDAQFDPNKRLPGPRRFSMAGIKQLQKRIFGAQSRDIEMVPLAGMASRGNAKVHDQEQLETKNGTRTIENTKDPKDPLLRNL